MHQPTGGRILSSHSLLLDNISQVGLGSSAISTPFGIQAPQVLIDEAANKRQNTITSYVKVPHH